jgi:hypothetical protein
MTLPLFSHSWLVNTLLDEGFVARKCLELAEQAIPYDLDARLAKNALLLSLSASWAGFAELAPLFDIQPADVPFTAKARDLLRADNDKTVARLYGISDAEFSHLLGSFKGMATKRPEYLALLQ